MTTITQTHTDTATTSAKTALDELAKLKEQARDTLGTAFAAETGHDEDHPLLTGDASHRLIEHETFSDLIDSSAWLAKDLVDILLKIAAGRRPYSVMRSDLPRRIQEAEVRLELLRQLNR
jgi:hypothetical protein